MKEARPLRDYLSESLVPVQAKRSPKYYLEAAIVIISDLGATQPDVSSDVQSRTLHAVATVDAEMACKQDVASIGIR